MCTAREVISVFSGKSFRMTGLTTSFVLFKLTFVRAFSWYACYLVYIVLVYFTTVQVIVVLPNNRKDRYDAIKKMCCVDNPGECVCSLSRPNLLLLSSFPVCCVSYTVQEASSDECRYQDLSSD